MLRASVLLLFLMLSMASAIKGDDFIFSRSILFCGGRNGGGTGGDDEESGDNTLACTTFVGDGYCHDASNTSYDFCYSETDLTLVECQQIAKNTAGAIGLNYIARANTCILLYYDNPSELICPENFDGFDIYAGTGPIDGSDGGDGVECYACED